MHTQRMKQMLRLLKEIKAQQKPFSLASWVRKLEIGKIQDCGTVACACGHAAMDPWFIEQGFKLVRDLNSFTGFTMCPEYRGELGFYAVEEFFELSSPEAFNLFAEGSYNSYEETTDPMVVYDRIIKTFPELNDKEQPCIPNV